VRFGQVDAELDGGDAYELGQAYRAFSKNIKHLYVFGGCCGTDHRHLEAICQSVTDLQTELLSVEK